MDFEQIKKVIDDVITFLKDLMAKVQKAFGELDYVYDYEAE